MSNDPGNPYASPQVPPLPPASHPGSLQFMEAFQYIFRNPNWLVNVLLVTVCMFIPVVGPIVMLGYMFDIIESLHRNGGQSYPDFDFNRFGYYLQRGVWPFLVALIAMAVIVPVMWVVMIIPFVCAGAIGNSGGGAEVIMMLAFIIVFILFVFVIAASKAVLLPLQLRAGLMQDFGGAFNFTFIRDFMGRMWLDVLMQALFLAAAGMVLGVAGLLLFCIGFYVAIAFNALAQGHFHYQLYEIYLSRGGEPIPMKPPATV